MVFSCNYNSLITHLQDIANIVEDPLAAEDDKSIVFIFSKTDMGNKVKLVGVSPVITFRRSLNEGDYTLTLDDEELDEKGEKLIIIKSKELLGFLNSYKSLRKTKVDELIFETVRNKVKCTVIESRAFTKEELDKINSDLEWNPDMPDPRNEHFHSSWMFDTVKVLPKKLPYIYLPVPDVELEHESDKGEFEFISRSMIPIVENATTLYGHMTFDEKYIVSYNSAFTAIMFNIIPGDTFKGIRLNYRTLSFINKIISSEEDIRFTKTDKHIYFKTNKSESYLKYDTKLAPYETQLKLYNNEHMVSVDRLYIKDILKRFSLLHDVIEVTIDSENSIIKMVNSKFSQEVPILFQKNFEEIGTIHFTITPENLDKAIIGDDSVFSNDSDSHDGETFIYYNKERSVICFGDCTKVWFTVLSVDVY